jgi:hypothetical protein
MTGFLDLLAWWFGWKAGPSRRVAGPYRAAAAASFVAGPAAAQSFVTGAAAGDANAQ